MTMFKKNGGFTLVELIVVIAILAILAGVAIPAYSGYIKKAQDAKVTTELDAIQTAAQAANAAAGKITSITVNGTVITVEAESFAEKYDADFVMFMNEAVTAGSNHSFTYKNGYKIQGWDESSYKNGAVWYAEDPDGNGPLKDGWNAKSK